MFTQYHNFDIFNEIFVLEEGKCVFIKYRKLYDKYVKLDFYK